MRSVCLYPSSYDSCRSLKSLRPYESTFSSSLSLLNLSLSLFLLGTLAISLDFPVKKSGMDFCACEGSDASSKVRAGVLIK